MHRTAEVGDAVLQHTAHQRTQRRAFARHGARRVLPGAAPPRRARFQPQRAIVRGAAKGYPVVLPREAVAGVPAEYGTAVIENSLSLLATVTTTDGLLAAWQVP
jgi:hypothetical protein